MKRLQLFETQGEVTREDADYFISGNIDIPDQTQEVIYINWQMLEAVRESLGRKALLALQIEQVVENEREE